MNNEHMYEGYKGKIEKAREQVKAIQAEARERHCSHILVMGDYCLSTLTNFELALDGETDNEPEHGGHTCVTPNCAAKREAS